MRLTKYVVLSTVLLAACNTDATEIVSMEESSASSQPSTNSILETKNVSYTGMVQPAGISVFTEGTHRLELASGKFIFLESTSLDLNGYVNETVEVFGSIRTTTKSDAVIMSVSDISLQESTSSQSSEESSVITSEAESSASSVESFSTSSSSLSQESSSVATSSVTSTSSEESSTTVVVHSAAFESRIVAMASEDVSPDRWTQQYCTGHIGFCIPVHKNWWFQSFGATASDLWHIEMNSAPLDTIHSGPISVRLTNGSLASIGKEDGSVQQKGGLVIGFRSWTEGRHFEITADARLEASVRYITDSLEVYTEE